MAKRKPASRVEMTCRVHESSSSKCPISGQPGGICMCCRQHRVKSRQTQPSHQGSAQSTLQRSKRRQANCPGPPPGCIGSGPGALGMALGPYRAERSLGRTGTRSAPFPSRLRRSRCGRRALARWRCRPAKSVQQRWMRSCATCACRRRLATGENSSTMFPPTRTLCLPRMRRRTRSGRPQSGAGLLE